ncbi:hypothetical protein M4L90_02630 [Staphylococcus equorum]|uniref:Uncharacterized protein n=1 Tax=Staphylococcus equorum TaxID=246432 RepID=A0A9X4L0Y8_9STAP|nr:MULTISPECIES: hypothetical protein [Staphylococcus]EJX17466.1 hypothetical protein SOJ_17550 [Staphylococcus sp. OJ82]MDG0818784.1 hypothetical protein [Staphylococcus equorum]MDG0839425.1 hypothetical protein [Staphylococcus equorum]MDG0844849.1 hypothetical protein [Staphylococcus equorum]
MEINEQEVKSYLLKLPTPDYFDDLTEDALTKHIFSAQEQINDFLTNYPNVDLSKRMIALQTLYNVESEYEGIAMLKRQGITDYTVKDVKAVLEQDEILSPNVVSIIEKEHEKNGTPKTTMRVGRLI